MRRTLLLALLAILAVPVAAFAGQEAPGDASFSVRKGDGFLAFSNFRGALLGKGDPGTQLEVEVTLADDCETLGVFGEDRILKYEKFDAEGTLKSVCSFTTKAGVLRWRLVGSQAQLIRIKKGREVALSAVGKGIVSIKGAGGLEDGQYSFNGEEYQSLPDELTRFTLAASANSSG